MIKNLECPDCGARMISRKQGATGQRFWGCSNYPICRGSRNTDGESRSDRRPDDEREPEDNPPSSRARENDRDRWRY